MKKRLWLILRRVIFLCILLGCIVFLGCVLRPQANADNPWPTTATIRDFYHLEPNTIDVLFLGSSRVIRAFSPIELYNSYGLTSYNLGTEEQSIPLSYFWLEEALRSQKPKVVVLDTFYLFDYTDELPLNMNEPNVRKALDFMHLSPVKLKAIWEIHQLDPSYDMLSFLFPIIRYHDRWELLDGETFAASKLPGLMGYSPNFDAIKTEVNYQPYEALHDEKIPMVPNMKMYLERIVALCRQNDIQLVLVNTPATAPVLEQHNTVQEFADENDLLYIDFNITDVFYSGIDYWLENDNSDFDHPNHWGGVKLTNYLGDIFMMEFDMEEHENSHWADLDALYQERIEAGEAAASEF